MKFWKKALLINSAVILAILASLAIFFATPWGKPVLKTILLVPEVVPNFPIHPLNLFSKPLIIEEVEIFSDSGKIKGYIYRPNDSRKHPTIILMITGVLPNSDLVVNYTKSFVKTGFVVVVPDFPELSVVEKVSLKTEQVDHLVSTFKAISQRDFVDSKNISFLGACAGASLSLVVAEDPSIASKVKSVVTISPYFNALTTYEQIYFKVVKENGKNYSWQPQRNTILTTDRLLINTLPQAEDRQILENFIERAGEKPGNLSEDAQIIFNFITNSKQESFKQLWDKLPDQTKKVLVKLSPSTKIKNLKAHVFILSDNKDTYIPHTESRALAKSLPSSQQDYIELDLLEHSQLSRKLPRLKSLIELTKVSLFVFKTLATIS